MLMCLLLFCVRVGGVIGWCSVFLLDCIVMNLW